MLSSHLSRLLPAIPVDVDVYIWLFLLLCVHGNSVALNPLLVNTLTEITIYTSTATSIASESVELSSIC
jgi:hypothetical protein